MPIDFFHGFTEELEKIAKPEKREKMVDAREPPVLARVAGGAMGAGMIAGQYPLVKGYAAGRSDLYHATNLNAAHGILTSPHGIDPAFAGAGQRTGVMDQVVGAMTHTAPSNKAARINRYLMAESLNRLLEEQGVPLDHEHMVRNVSQFHELMDKGMPASQAASHIAGGVTSDLVSSGKMTPQQAEAMTQKLQQTLPSFGRRVYMGTHPADVRAWASGKSELQMMAEKHLAQQQRMSTTGGKIRSFAEDMGNALLGGVPTTARDIAHRMQYKPASTENMTLAQAQQELARLKATGSKGGAIFGASVPTGQMGYMQDFPVVRQLVNINPGIKSSLSKYVETYDPGRDLSFPHAIPSKNIHTVDLVDHATGAVRRIKITDAERAAAAPLGQRLKRLAAPAAFTGLGGLALYRAFKPKKRKVPESSPLAAPKGEKKQKPMKWGLSKASSVGSDVRSVAKYVLPVVGGVGAVAAGSHALADRISPDKKVDPKLKGTKKLKALTVQGLHSAGKGLAASLATTGIGAGVGALAAKPIASKILGQEVGSKIPKLRAIGAGAGALISNAIAPSIIAGREAAKTPEADPYYQMLPDKAQNFVRKHPSVGALREGAIWASIPIGGAYAVRKYYPSAYAKAALGVRKAVSKFRG